MTKMMLELVPVPVSDLDKAKAFYSDKLGFTLDVDVKSKGDVRVIQLTPPGSACSIMLSTGLPDVAMQSGSLRLLHLVVADVAKTRELLLKQGVDVSAIDDHPQGMRFAYFSDPDGNTWALQEMPWRAQDFI